MASLIHLASCEGLKSELDLFALPATQTSIDHGRVVEHRLTSILSENSPVEFVISEKGNYYIDLAKTFLYVRAAVVNEDGSNLAEDANIAPITNFLQSLVSSRSQFKQYSDYSIEQYLCISSVYRDAVKRQSSPNSSAINGLKTPLSILIQQQRLMLGLLREN